LSPARTGIVPAAGMTSASDMLATFNEQPRNANVGLSKTFDDRFVKKAAGM
jgi:NitT/TauT family transport system substrate-binding protein